MPIKKLLILALALLAPLHASAEPAYNRAIEKLIDSAHFKKMPSIGISIMDVETGEILCDKNDQKLLKPASNMKLITTGTALLALGADHKFTTSIYSVGEIENGILAGHLVVVAGGDPSISGREYDGHSAVIFDALAAKIAKTVQKVRGDLVIDDSAFDRQYVHPSWPDDQIVRWYCAPVSAFALNDNCINVSVRPTSPKQNALVILDPPTQYFQIRNTCVTVPANPKAKTQPVITRLETSDTLVVSGTVATDDAEDPYPVAVMNPALFAATVLRERLAAAGIEVTGRIVFLNTRTDTSRMTLLASVSHSLVSAINVANRRSQNFYAEMILKTMGRERHEPSSWADGIAVAAAELKKAGIEPGTYTMDDGSGMSKQNAFSALQFTTFMRYMALSRYKDVYIDSLAVTGAPETSLAKRLPEAPYAGRISAKTGHVLGVSALSGYARAGGRLLAFSIIVNDDNLDGVAARVLQDSICKFLIDTEKEPPPPRPVS